MKINIPALFALGACTFSGFSSEAAENNATERPNLDRFTEQAVRYSSTFTSIGVAEPSRYALINGRFFSADGVLETDVDEDIYYVSYMRGRTGSWELYDGPVEDVSGEKVRIRAERIGFVQQESEELFR